MSYTDRTKKNPNAPKKKREREYSNLSSVSKELFPRKCPYAPNPNRRRQFGINGSVCRALFVPLGK
jgi:hypothetical protein